MLATRPTNDFGRFQVFTGLYETVCLACHRPLGISKNVRGLEILEKAHKCPKCSGRIENSGSGSKAIQAA